MPDVGDTVVVYYETGNSDKIVCIASRHVNDSPDFKWYQDKMLTADNRMVKFGDKSIEIVGNRAKHDKYKGEQAKIIFNDEFGMQIQSTNEIRLQTTNRGNIIIQSVAKGFQGMNATKQKFELMYGIGNTMFVATGGGIPDTSAISPAKAVAFEKIKQNIEENIDSPLQVVDAVQELAGSIGGTAGTENAETSEGYQDGVGGVVNIYAVDSLVLKVGSSSITFANGVIQIKAGKFRQLGSDRVKGGGKGSGFTWQDMILDVGAVGADVSGALPVPKTATAENLRNAGVSLAETEYIGEALEAATKAVSLSVGGKSDSPSIPKPVSAAANRVKKFQTGAEGGRVKLSDGIGTEDTKAADASYSFESQENRQDFSAMMTMKRKNNEQTRYKENNKKKSQKTQNTNKDKSSTAKTSKRKTKGDMSAETRKRETNGDPIDMVTGSYLVEQSDFIINDICGIYAVKRTYESLLSDEDSPIGRGWTLSLFSTAYIYDDRIEVVLPDNHTETFLKTEEGYRNRRGGTKRKTLQAQEDGYLLKEAETGITRFYDADGKLLYESDHNGNRRVYQYAGGTLRRISFASGQYLDFVWEGSHILSIQDCIGRKVSYHYEGSLLTEVEMVTGGVESYTYDSEGRITDIINANGITYVHNEYDQKGRVTRQTLYNGQEYIMLYSDDDRMNTYLVPKSSKEIRYIYNRNRLLTCTKYQDGTTQERGYDDWENIIWEKDRNGNETRRTYDEYSNLLTEERADGLVISYAYDVSGNCLHMWDNSGMDIHYTYDKKGNLIEETEQVDSSISRSVVFEYDRYGRITAFTDANGHQERYRHESGFWESTTFTTAGGSVYEHRLDEAGRCVSVVNADGESTYAYNSFDILCMATNPLGHTTRYLYDRVTDLVGLVRPNHYAPDSANELKERYIYMMLSTRGWH